MIYHKYGYLFHHVVLHQLHKFRIHQPQDPHLLSSFPAKAKAKSRHERADQEITQIRLNMV